MYWERVSKVFVPAILWLLLMALVQAFEVTDVCMSPS